MKSIQRQQAVAVVCCVAFIAVLSATIMIIAGLNKPIVRREQLAVTSRPSPAPQPAGFNSSFLSSLSNAAADACNGLHVAAIGDRVPPPVPPSDSHQRAEPLNRHSKAPKPPQARRRGDPSHTTIRVIDLPRYHTPRVGASAGGS